MTTSANPELVERVAIAIYDATVAKARGESAHVSPWEKLPAYWRDIHRTSARAAINAMSGESIAAPLSLNARHEGAPE